MLEMKVIHDGNRVIFSVTNPTEELEQLLTAMAAGVKFPFVTPKVSSNGELSYTAPLPKTQEKEIEKIKNSLNTFSYPTPGNDNANARTLAYRYYFATGIKSVLEKISRMDTYYKKSPEDKALISAVKEELVSIVPILSKLNGEQVTEVFNNTKNLFAQAYSMIANQKGFKVIDEYFKSLDDENKIQMIKDIMMAYK